MTREEAIEILKQDKALYETETVRAGDGTTDGELLLALEIALSALRAQQESGRSSKVVESNEPLTMDELREMDGEPVFLVDLVHKSDPKVPDLWGGWIVFTKHDQNGFIPRGCGFFSNDGYGKTWMAYSQKKEV